MSRLLSRSYDESLDKIPEEYRLEHVDSFWMELFSPLCLFRFVADDSTPITLTQSPPILLVHGHNSSHLTWNHLALSLWQLGFRHIFAIDLFSHQDKTERKLYSQLHASIDIILNSIIKSSFIYAIGHSLGGILLRSYIKTFAGERNKIKLCITLGSPHYGMFSKFVRFKKLISSLSERLIHASETTFKLFSPDKKGHLGIMNSIITKEEYHTITMVNIMGSLKRYFNSDGTFKPKSVSDMVNYIVPASHFNINKINETFQFIKQLLVKELRIFKIRLIYIEHDLFSFHPYRMFFSFQKQDQNLFSFPINETLLISTSDLVPDIPYIMYTDVYEAKHTDQNNLTISVYKLPLNQTMHSKNNLLIAKTLNIHKEYLKSPITFITITDSEQNVKITFELITYCIGHELS